MHCPASPVLDSSLLIQPFIHCFPRQLKYADDTTSRDSDSLIQDYNTGPNNNNNLPIYFSTTTGGSGTHYTTCWRHPKVRENWRTVLAAFALLFVGTGLVVMGAFTLSETSNTSQGEFRAFFQGHPPGRLPIHCLIF